MIPAPEGSSRRGLRLRTVLIFMLIAVALYASGFSAYLLLRIGPAAERLREDTSPVLFLFGRLAERSRGLDGAVDEARRVVTARTRSEQDIAALRARVQWQTQVAGPGPFARIPLDMRIALARTDEDASRLESKLTEVYALVELGRFDEAESRMRVVDLLHDRVSSSLAEAERLGLRDLVDREIALEATLRQAVQAVLWWVVVGALLLPLGLFFIRQRLERPLRDIDRGFARVAEGDLHATVPIRRLDEIGRLAAHFNEMTRVLRMRAEQQGRFAAAGELLAGVAHEVNNPLMAICAVAENRLDDPGLSEDQREELGQIIRQAQRAGKLLSGLLRFVRAEQERVGSVDLNMVVRAAVDLVSYQFTVDMIEHQESLDPDLPPAVGNHGRLEQVFVNLLSNALDALRTIPPPRRIRLMTASSASEVIATIEDSGPGIEPAMAERLFLPFVTTKGPGGTGLGLYISRQIVREFGGTLTLENTKPGATRFTVRLPVHPSGMIPAHRPRTTPGAATDAAAASRPLEGLRILLVEDEVAVRNPVGRFLVKRGAVVREASDGFEALAELKKEPAEVILADVRMPNMDGVELFKTLEATRPDLANRVVFLSGDLSQLQQLEPRSLPRDRILVKPVELEELERCILRVARVQPETSGIPED